VFLDWFNQDSTNADADAVLKAGLAHLWFMTIHPFADGNGRIARAIADLALARSEQSPHRFYSMSAQIRRERGAYDDILEQTREGGLDVTPWMEWFVACLGRAIDGAQTTLSAVLQKACFWRTLGDVPINERQRLMLSRLLDGFEGNLATSEWATIVRCSSDTALRDMAELVEREGSRAERGRSQYIRSGQGSITGAVAFPLEPLKGPFLASSLQCASWIGSVSRMYSPRRSCFLPRSVAMSFHNTLGDIETESSASSIILGNPERTLKNAQGGHRGIHAGVASPRRSAADDRLRGGSSSSAALSAYSRSLEIADSSGLPEWSARVSETVRSVSPIVASSETLLADASI
jgi:hypothetical protein